MSKQEEALKYKILSRLHAGESAKDVANDEDISYAKVLRMKKELDDALVNGLIDSALDMNRVIAEAQALQIAKAASAEPPTEAQVKEIVKSVDGLTRLSDEFQSTATAISMRIKAMVILAESPSELATLTDALCDLQSAFFNQNSTQVNVQNNFGALDGQSRYGAFLGDAIDAPNS